MFSPSPGNISQRQQCARTSSLHESCRRATRHTNAGAHIHNIYRKYSSIQEVQMCLPDSQPSWRQTRTTLRTVLPIRCFAYSDAVACFNAISFCYRLISYESDVQRAFAHQFTFSVSVCLPLFQKKRTPLNAPSSSLSFFWLHPSLSPVDKTAKSPHFPIWEEMDGW